MRNNCNHQKNQSKHKQTTERKKKKEETMGLLKKGKPMSWFEASPYVNYVREHGIKQFLIIYNKVKNRKDDVLKWGDEVGIF